MLELYSISRLIVPLKISRRMYCRILKRIERNILRNKIEVLTTGIKRDIRRILIETFIMGHSSLYAIIIKANIKNDNRGGIG